MSKVIATIKLAPGKVAFYDEYSHIHLTIANPIAYIYEDTPLKRIKASIRSGNLRVINGSLAGKSEKKDTPVVITPKKTEKKPDVTPIKPTITEPVVEPVAEDVVKETVVDEAHVEPVAEKTTKKGRKKSQEAVEASADEVAAETAE